MATTNPVFQVLVTKGNQAPLEKDQRPDALANGQIGVFNPHSGLSVDATSAADLLKEIYIAVGINRTSGGTAAAEDLQKSAGQVIQVRNMRFLTFKGYTPAIQKVVEVAGFSALADTSYGLKIEYRNAKSYGINGYNPLVKTFGAQTSVNPDPLETAGNNGELAQQLINAINADPDGLATAVGFAYKITATVNAAATANGTLVITVGTEVFDVDVLNADTTAAVAAKIVAAINATDSSIYTASLSGSTINIYPKVSAATGSTTATIVLTSAGGSGVTFNAISAANVTIGADVTAFRAAVPDGGIAIRITTVAQVRPNANADINIMYYKTGTDIIVSLPYGFDGVGSAVVITQLRYVEGSGYDLKYKEYQAGGWNGKPGPYRQSTLTGLARNGFEYFTDPTVNYHQFCLGYDQQSVGGWLEYLNNLETIIGIPIADSTTYNGLVAIFDVIFTQFGAMTGDVAANDTEQVSTNTLLPATDGIESLS